MSVRKEALYGNSKGLFQKPVKRVWFKLNPLLEKTSLFLQDDTEESKFTLPLRSVVICEKILENDTAFQTGCTEVDFWEYLYSERWRDWCTVRVFEGQLLDWLIEGLHALQESDTISTCQSRVFTENIRITRNPLKDSEKCKSTEITETLRLSYTYYGKRNGPIENMFSGSTAYPASTMSGPDFDDFMYADVEGFALSESALAKTETNDDEGKDVEPSSVDTEDGRDDGGVGGSPNTANVSSDLTGNDRESTNQARRVTLSSEADESIRYWNNGTSFSQRYSRLDSDSDSGYGKEIGLSILTPQRLPLNDNMPSPFTPYKQWAKLKEAARTSRNYSIDSSVMGENSFRLPSIYDVPKFMCSRIIRTPPDREDVANAITAEEEEEEEYTDPFVEELSLWLTDTMKHMTWNDERVVDRLRRRRTELAEERQRNKVTREKVEPGQHLSEVNRIIEEYESTCMEFPILKRCHPVPTFEQFLLQLLDDEDFDPRFRVNKRRVRKIAKRYNLKGDKNQAALVQAMKEEQGKGPPSLLEDLRIMFLPRYPRDCGNRASKRSPRKKETQEKKKSKVVKGVKDKIHKEGSNTHRVGNVFHKEGKEPAHTHDKRKKTKAGAAATPDAQHVESARSIQSQKPDNEPGSSIDGQFVETVVGITDCPAFRHSLVGITENEEGSYSTSTTPQQRKPSGPRGSPEITITVPGSSDAQQLQGSGVDGRQMGHNRGHGVSQHGTPPGRGQGTRHQGTPSEGEQSSNSERSAGEYSGTPDDGGHNSTHHGSQNRKDGQHVKSPKSADNERLAVGGVRAVKSQKSGIVSPHLNPEPSDEGGLAGNLKAKPRRHKGEGNSSIRVGSGVFPSKSKQGSSRMSLSKGSSRKGGSTANLSRGKSSVDTHRSSRPMDTAESIPVKGSNGTSDRDMDESPDGDYGIPELFDGSKINRRYSFDRMRAKRKDEDRPNFKDILKKYMKVQKAVGVFKKNNAPKTKFGKLRGSGKGFQNPFQLSSPSPSPEQGGLKAFFGKALGKKRRMAVVPVPVVIPDFRHLGPTEFRRKLLKALEDFVVRKEQVISSHKHRSITCITFTRSHIFL